GDTVFDVSGVGAALNLEINNPNATTWGNGILNLNSPSLIASVQAADKLIDGITETQEVTMEAWLTPSNRTQNGPARIATLSGNTSNRNFTFGQAGDDYNVRFRTTTTGNNGVGASVSSTGGLLSTELTHVVYTREADGDAFLYVNNNLVASQTIGGNLSNWDDNYRFGLGNEFNGNRSWLGSLDLFAVYNQAFDANEVAQNFFAGSDGSQSPTPPNPGNSIPVAANDSITTNEDTQVNINVLANDSDDDGDNLTITSVGSGSNGTTEIVDNQVVYTPNTNFNGVDSFSYEISDGDGGTDTAQVTVTVTESGSNPSDRVTEGLLALYNFNEGSGDTVFDVSEVGTALNLEIDDLTGVTWGDGVLNINSPSLIASVETADKLIDGITATQEITLEAWITPGTRTQNGPARIATLSSNTSNRNFTLGQAGD
ncbi:MAG: LamG-like jellyroll fold domain-containing protein, partial [Cyanobacteria bacterium J06649_11]